MAVRANPDAATGQRIAFAGILASSALAVMNIAVGLITNSTSVFATGVEFAGDVLAAAVVLFGMFMAGRPPDSKHPYGYGRVEILAAFVVGLVLTVGGAGICWSSLQAIGVRHAPPTGGAIVALLIAIGIRGVMFVIKFGVGRRIRSASLVADAWNDAVDILSALAALTAVALAIYDSDRFMAADHYGGFAVGVVVIATGVRVLRDASLELMDTMPDGRMMGQVRATALSVPGITAVEKAFARKTGLQYHVDLHVEVDPAMPVIMAHALGGQVRHRVRTELHWVADVLIHLEPSRTSSRRVS